MSQENKEYKSQEKRPRKLSGIQIFAFTLLVMVIGLLSGFFGALSLFAASSDPDSEFCNDFPVFKDIICEEDKIEQVTDVASRVIAERREVIEESSIIDLVKESKPAVVSILIRQEGLEFIFGRSSESTSSGTGFFVTSDGVIATNRHVVESAINALGASEINIILDSGDVLKAEVAAIDNLNDLAFLRITSDDNRTFEFLNFADSENVQVGQKVISIGNSLGEQDNVVNTGIVSALGRVIQVSDPFGRNERVLEGMIQMDAAINLGNSGGPLLDMDGRVIGINTAGRSNASLVNYSIPSNQVEPALNSFLDTGDIERGYVGINAISVTKGIKAQFDLDEVSGAIVTGVAESLDDQPTPAAQIGLRENDIILSIDGEKITPVQTLSSILYNLRPGDVVEFEFLRGDETFTEEAELIKPPDPAS